MINGIPHLDLDKLIILIFSFFIFYLFIHLFIYFFRKVYEFFEKNTYHIGFSFPKMNSNIFEINLNIMKEKYNNLFWNLLF